MACNVLCGAQLTQLCPCFFRLPLVGSMGPLDCYRPGGPRFAPAAITRIRIERARAEPQAAQCAFVALDAPSRRRGQCEKEFVTLLDLCVSSLRRGHANLLCIVPILTDDPRRESESSEYTSAYPAHPPSLGHCLQGHTTTTAKMVRQHLICWHVCQNVALHHGGLRGERDGKFIEPE